MDNIKKDMNYAVVIGDWHFNSLGVVRSLGENVEFANSAALRFCTTPPFSLPLTCGLHHFLRDSRHLP